MTELVLLHDAARDVVVRFATDACAGDEAAILTIELLVKGQVRDSVVVATQREPASCNDVGRTVAVGDFNFDGYDDLAVPVDNAGPYGGQTYAILLFHAASGHYAEAPRLSALTRENLGLFAVDKQRKRLRTFNKSGCCVHFKSKFAVVHDEPILRGSEVESIVYKDDHCYVILKSTDENGKSRTTGRACTKDELQ
jgi:FG-GAP repeat